ncbi:MAG: riboflavin synthase [Luteibacter sp.]|jgi:riboflavin synthase|uniref:riboflavin synthase n=1 Tax=Rhodanobacteraceae TaxID=1775411 RepID=UPI00055E7A90|nr:MULTISPECIES: riboflavin synthase [Rhodanobacteraceae]MDQ7997490.1 riboflavin synthase [Luteibacter sp.]MDQ8050046.1 riboflavin synthase [Luteibacter sp.]MDR6643050.1 riboflavin synthase [Luteibacter sp. 1214]SDF92761.1 riboflavin synthase alpha chain [Dyella sp. 333MFSha]SKB94085.1 riboflavin synthase alpha chain [Luteibacter sp. 22Crub2.1]
MFTGIIQAVGRIARLEPRGGDVRLVVDTASLDMSDVALGDSIAVSGVCLTVIEFDAKHFAADVSNETLAHTTLGQHKAGDPVNLEKALRLADRLGGHLVSGHVDGAGKVVSVVPDGRSQRWTFEVPADLARYIAHKGSVCIDGTSLTVNEVSGHRFGVNLIPHTVEHTAFSDRRPGDAVNIEVDVVARYVERLLASGDAPRLDEAFLKQHGFA